MSGSWLAALGIVGGLASLLGLPLTIYVAKRSDRRKLLTFDVSEPVPLASVFPQGGEHRLSIVYEQRGARAIKVKGAYLHFLRIGNLGRDPVRRQDLVPSDPMRVEVRGGKVLDIAITSKPRPGVNFSVGPVQVRTDGSSSTEMEFDFMDCGDGAVITLLSDSPQAAIKVEGSVIGMPDGIRRLGLHKGKLRVTMGAVLSALLYGAAVAGYLYLYRSVMGDWSRLWVVALPVVVIFLPAILIAIVATTVWPKGIAWPKAMTLPTWLRFLPPSDLIIQYGELRGRSRREGENGRRNAARGAKRVGQAETPG
jgi:hypothetical protein